MHGRLSKSGLHADTVAKVYRLFRTMLDAAFDDGLLRSDPVHIKGAAVERSIERPMLDWDDIERIADAIHPRFRTPVWVGATSGLRYGELTGLTRRHVDLADRSLRVDQAPSFMKGQGPTLGPPKSATAHRTVVIPSGVAEMLAAHLAEYVDDEADAGLPRQRLEPRSARSWHVWGTLPPTPASATSRPRRAVMPRSLVGSSAA